jgi:hypothetical protein
MELKDADVDACRIGASAISELNPICGIVRSFELNANAPI